MKIPEKKLWYIGKSLFYIKQNDNATKGTTQFEATCDLTLKKLYYINIHEATKRLLFYLQIRKKEDKDE